MKVNLENIKNIELCYENCEVDTVFYGSLLGVSIPRKRLCSHTYQNKPTYNIKTFEIALKDTDYELRTDLAQLTINYLDGSLNHFYVVWGKNDCPHSYSTLQKVHKKDSFTSLTSNCESSFLK